MAKRETLISTFNGGELSPLMSGRIDLEKYQAGCSTLRNFILHAQGPAYRRPGMRYAGECYDHAKQSHLIPFVFSNAQAYAMEFSGAGIVQFFTQGGQVLASRTITGATQANPCVITAVGHQFKDGQTVTISGVVGMTELNGNTYTVGSPAADTFQLVGTDASGFTAYSSGGTAVGKYLLAHGYADGDAVDIQTAASADVLYLAHPDHPPAKLTRLAHDNWTIADVVFDEPPWRDQNEETTTIASSATAKDATTTLTASAATFNADMVGGHIWMAQGYVLITAYTDATHVTGTIKKALTSGAATAAWNESSWSVYRGFPRSVQFYEERLCWGGNAAEPQKIWLSKSQDYEDHGISSPVVDSDACQYALSSGQVNAIAWMIGADKLYVGTTGGYWWLSGSTFDEPITPTSINIGRQESRVGAAGRQPVAVGRVILYLSRWANQLHELTRQDDQTQTEVAADVSLLAEHLLRTSGITQMALQEYPGPVVWGVREDGALLGVTYMREHKVVGWHRHDTGGDDVESICCIPGATQDELWLIVAREIDGQTRRYVEFIDPIWTNGDISDAFFVDSGLTFHNFAAITGISQTNPAVVTCAAGHSFADGNYVRITGVQGIEALNGSTYQISNCTGTTFEIDSSAAINYDELLDTLGEELFDTTGSALLAAESGSGLPAYTGGGLAEQMAITISGLSHLEGRTVAVLQDGSVGPQRTVAAGSITMQSRAAKIHVGLPYFSDISPMPLEAMPGTSSFQGKAVTLYRAVVRLIDTIGAQVGEDEASLVIIPFRTVNDVMGEAVSIFSGDIELNFPGNFDTAARIVIRQGQPLPMTVLALFCELEVN